jgi:hypothetical protein
MLLDPRGDLLALGGDDLEVAKASKSTGNKLPVAKRTGKDGKTYPANTVSPRCVLSSSIGGGFTQPGSIASCDHGLVTSGLPRLNLNHGGLEGVTSC